MSLPENSKTDDIAAAQALSRLRLPGPAFVLVAVGCVLATLFCLSYAWEFWLEALTCRSLGLPYDAIQEAEDNWRYIWTSFAFATFSMILPTLFTLRTLRLLKRTVAAVAQSQREANASNIAKTRFLANMSHELRTPLNAIIGFSEFIKDALFGPVSERYRDYANDIHRSGQHLLSVINDVLDLSKSETHSLKIELREIRLQDKIGAIEPMVAPLCRKGKVDLFVDLPASLPAVRVDSVRLNQVMLNLLSNAIKFTPAGGSVTVDAHEAGGFVVLGVTDTGIGIAKEHLQDVLKPFFQVDSDLSRKHDGTGLGLPLTVRLIELMGGRFTLESKLGAGTRATVYLPIAIAEERVAA